MSGRTIKNVVGSTANSNKQSKNIKKNDNDKKNKKLVEKSAPSKKQDKDEEKEDNTYYNKQCTKYDFRISVNRPSNDERIEKNTIHKVLKSMCNKWVFQEEKGNETGYLHYQGRIRLIKKTIQKTVLAQFIKIFKEKFDFPIGDCFQYLRPTTNTVNKTSDFSYVMKEDTRVEGPWTDKDYIEEEKVWIPEHLRFLNVNTMRPFQKKVYDLSLIRLDARTIYWIYNKNGGAGKSTIAEYIDLHGGISIDYMGDPEKIIQSLCNITMTKNVRDVKGIVIDIPKSMHITDEFYVTIEIIKKGKFVDMRNRYKDWRINPPPVIIFSNKLPDIKTLSKDRWEIYTITDDMNLEIFDIKEEMKKAEKKKEENKVKKMF